MNARDRGEQKGPHSMEGLWPPPLPGNIFQKKGWPLSLGKGWFPHLLKEEVRGAEENWDFKYFQRPARVL